MVASGGSAATRTYNPLGGAYYRSYGCVLLSRGSRRRRTLGVQLLASGVYNYERFDYGILCISDEDQRVILSSVQLLLVVFDLTYNIF